MFFSHSLHRPTLHLPLSPAIPLSLHLHRSTHQPEKQLFIMQLRRLTPLTRNSNILLMFRRRLTLSTLSTLSNSSTLSRNTVPWPPVSPTRGRRPVQRQRQRRRRPSPPRPRRRTIPGWAHPHPTAFTAPPRGRPRASRRECPQRRGSVGPGNLI